MLITSLCVSLLLNVLLMWYIAKLLKKFLFISENLSDLYLTTKAFQVFVKALYSMDNYSGEPMVEELILRIRDVTAEMERFREIFEFTLDEEIEEELNAAEEEEAPQPL